MSDKALKPDNTPDLSQYAEVGDVVHYYPGGDMSQEPQVGIVTLIGVGSVTVNIVSSGMGDTLPMDGVRHIDDKTAQSDEVISNGAWKHKPETLFVREGMIRGGKRKWLDDRLVSPEVYDSRERELAAIAAKTAPVQKTPAA